jgi:signal transduction histidine kinase
MNSKPMQIEPGLLSVFRLYAGARLVLLILSQVIQLTDPNQPFPRYPLFGILSSAFLLVYLAPLWLRRQMGRWYLPVALFIASVEPILGRHMAVLLRMLDGYRDDAALTDSGQLFLLLAVPLILISTQYRFWTMVAFCVGTVVLEVIAAIPAALVGGPRLQLTVEEAFIRLLIFLLVGYVVVRMSSAQRAHRRSLAETNTQLTRYATTLEQLAISRERNRMARELHDTLAHTLSAVAVQLEAVDAIWDSDPGEARHTLHQSQEIVRSGLKETRRALQSLRASPLEDLGAILAIRHLAETTAERAGLTLNLTLPDSLGELRPEVELSLYRITEEALSNIVRHANARQLTVKLTQNSSIIQLIVSDDGLGFNPATTNPNGHYGLVGMKERALLCGGTLHITSQPNQGTTITLSIER